MAKPKQKQEFSKILLFELIYLAFRKVHERMELETPALLPFVAEKHDISEILKVMETMMGGEHADKLWVPPEIKPPQWRALYHDIKILCPGHTIPEKSTFEDEFSYRIWNNIKDRPHEGKWSKNLTTLNPLSLYLFEDITIRCPFFYPDIEIGYSIRSYRPGFGLNVINPHLDPGLEVLIGNCWNAYRKDKIQQVLDEILEFLKEFKNDLLKRNVLTLKAKWTQFRKERLFLSLPEMEVKKRQLVKEVFDMLKKI